MSFERNANCVKELQLCHTTMNNIYLVSLFKKLLTIDMAWTCSQLSKDFGPKSVVGQNKSHSAVTPFGAAKTFSGRVSSGR